MNKNKCYNISLIASLGILMSGCATTLINDLHGPAPIQSTVEKRQKIFSDQIISYGIPATPIKNHEYAIAMAGKEYSYLIQPADSFKKTLFRDFFNQLDTQYLAFTTPKEMNADPSKANSIQQLSFDIEKNKIKQTLMFIFIKPMASLKDNEQAKMEQFQFQCHVKLIEQKSYLTCKQNIAVELTVATKAQNTHQLAQQFRTPLTFDFYQLDTSHQYNLKKLALAPFYPLTVTYDILSIPVLAGLAYMGIEGPANKALEGLF